MNYVILDLEATCEHDGSMEHEIIEIGAVKVNEAGEVVDSFQTFVKPVINPVLTPFCINLTTIEQKDVEKAPEFKEAIASFQQWIGEESYLLGSWGFYDRKQLVKDCEFHKVPTDWTTPHMSVKHEYANIKRLKRACGVSKALKLEGMQFEGTPHRGIDDAQNIARIFVKYQKQLLQNM